MVLTFTTELDTHFRDNVFPRILVAPNKYTIKGSFRRKIPYITDIDVVNDAYPSVDKTSVANQVVGLIKSFSKSSNSDIILVYVTCGTDDRYMITTVTDQELDRIKQYLPYDDIIRLNAIVDKYAHEPEKKLFYVREIVWERYKLRWRPENILKDELKLFGDVTKKFSEVVKNSSVVLLQYYVVYKNQPIGVDVIVRYERQDLQPAYTDAADYQLQVANYGREYYYMMFPFKYYFRYDKQQSMELENIIEKKFGLYKQLMVRCDAYRILHVSHNMSIELATNMIDDIIKDLSTLPPNDSDKPFASDIIDGMNEAKKIPEKERMKLWSKLLKKLYKEVNDTVNRLAKPFFFKYLNKVPGEQRRKFYLSNRVI